MDELLGHVVRKRAAVALGDELQHHVERRRSAGTSAAIPVDHEDVGRGADARKLFGERREALPVQRAAAAVEQAGAGEHIGAQADAAD